MDDGTGRAHAPKTPMTRNKETRVARGKLRVITWLRRAEPQPTARPKGYVALAGFPGVVQVRCQSYFAYGPYEAAPRSRIEVRTSCNGLARSETPGFASDLRGPVARPPPPRRTSVAAARRLLVDHDRRRRRLVPGGVRRHHRDR